MCHGTQDCAVKEVKKEKNMIFGQQSLSFCEVMALSKFNFQFIGDIQLFQVCFQ